MNILGISGNHPRHLYYLNTIHKTFPLAGMILEERENMVPEPPLDISEHDQNNFITHFQKRDIAESYYFRNREFPDCPTLKLETKNLNSQKTVDFVKRVKPDLVLIFGSGMIREPLLSALPHNTINLHGGLSPRYRGAATLFWPFYFMEPMYAGCTFHYIVSEPDAGGIIHQTTPPLDVTDGIHDVGCKAIIAATADMIKLLDIFNRKGEWQVFKQKGFGRNFLRSDFKPEHLKVIYGIFGDNMVKYCLEGKLSASKPILVRQY